MTDDNNEINVEPVVPEPGNAAHIPLWTLTIKTFIDENGDEVFTYDFPEGLPSDRDVFGTFEKIKFELQMQHYDFGDDEYEEDEDDGM